MDLSLTTKWSGHVMMNSRMSTHRWYFVQSSGSLIRMGLGTDLGHSLRSSIGTKNNVKHIRIFPVIVNSWFVCLFFLWNKWMNQQWGLQIRSCSHLKKKIRVNSKIFELRWCCENNVFLNHNDVAFKTTILLRSVNLLSKWKSQIYWNVYIAPVL